MARGWRFESCNFGVASGILTTHSTADVSFGAYCLAEVTFVKCKLSSSTPIGSQSNCLGRSVIRYQRHQDVANAGVTL